MLCVIAKIDDAARKRLDALCKVAEEFHLPARYLYGHITLVTYLGQQETAFVRQCKQILACQTAFSVFYNRIEILYPTPSIVASPERTPELMQIQARLAGTAPGELDRWTSPVRWHPHTTLFYHETADLQRISGKMAERFVPFHAGIGGIEFSRVTENGYDILDSIVLPSTGD